MGTSNPWIAPRKRIPYGLAARRLGEAEFVQIMDTKTGKKLLFTGDEWRDFIDAIKAGAGDDLVPLDAHHVETTTLYKIEVGDPALYGVGPVFTEMVEPLAAEDMP